MDTLVRSTSLPTMSSDNLRAGAKLLQKWMSPRVRRPAPEVPPNFSNKTQAQGVVIQRFSQTFGQRLASQVLTGAFASRGVFAEVGLMAIPKVRRLHMGSSKLTAS